jgi:prepilin-type N-terminal cleavage/methylation domain-containing protein
MQRRSEDGFTLIEVMIAISMLAIVVLAMATMTTTFVRTVNDNKRRNEANAIADAQISRVREEPMYDSLAARYAGTVTITNAPYTFTRVTTITTDATLSGVADNLNDYKRVTVSVSASGLTPAVNRTVTVARP